MRTQRQYPIFAILGTPAAVLLLTLGVATAAAAQEEEPPPPAGDPTPATTADPPAPRKPPDLGRRDMELLAADLAPQSVRWLEAGGERFLTLYEADYTGAPQGAILMLHAEGQHPAAHATLEAIRRQLPHHGWATLAAMLPSPGTPPVPPRPAPVAGAPATAGADPMANPEAGTGEGDKTAESEQIFDDSTGEVTDGRDPEPVQEDSPTPAEGSATPAVEPPKPVETQVAERLQAALQFLQDQGIFNIVILGQGVGGGGAAEFYRQLQSPAPGSAAPIQALLLINARNSIPLTEVDLPRCLTNPALPVLDLYHGFDPRDQREAQLRRRHAQRQRLTHFVQLRLPVPAVRDPDQNQLMRRIRGFLEKHAAGMEIDRN